MTDAALSNYISRLPPVSNFSAKKNEEDVLWTTSPLNIGKWAESGKVTKATCDIESPKRGWTALPPSATRSKSKFLIAMAALVVLCVAGSITYLFTSRGEVNEGIRGSVDDILNRAVRFNDTYVKLLRDRIDKNSTIREKGLLDKRINIIVELDELNEILENGNATTDILEKANTLLRISELYHLLDDPSLLSVEREKIIEELDITKMETASPTMAPTNAPTKMPTHDVYEHSLMRGARNLTFTVTRFEDKASAISEELFSKVQMELDKVHTLLSQVTDVVDKVDMAKGVLMTLKTIPGAVGKMFTAAYTHFEGLYRAVKVVKKGVEAVEKTIKPVETVISTIDGILMAGPELLSPIGRLITDWSPFLIAPYVCADRNLGAKHTRTVNLGEIIAQLERRVAQIQEAMLKLYAVVSMMEDHIRRKIESLAKSVKVVADSLQAAAKSSEAFQSASDSADKEIKISPFIDVYNRGLGSFPRCPMGREKDTADQFCYPKCKSGFSPVSASCVRNCPTGFTDVGVACKKPSPRTITSRPADCPSSHPNKIGAVCYKNCNHGWTAKSAKCAAPCFNKPYDCMKKATCSEKITKMCKKFGVPYPCGFINNFYECTKPGKCYSWTCPEEDRPMTNPNRCNSNEELEALFCYKKCSSGHKRSGLVCNARCPSTMVDLGATCTKDAYPRGVPIAATVCGINEELVPSAVGGARCYPKPRAGYVCIEAICTMEKDLVFTPRQAAAAVGKIYKTAAKAAEELIDPVIEQALKPLIDLLVDQLPDEPLFNPEELIPDELKKMYEEIMKMITDRIEDLKAAIQEYTDKIPKDPTNCPEIIQPLTAFLKTYILGKVSRFIPRQPPPKSAPITPYTPLLHTINQHRACPIGIKDVMSEIMNARAVESLEEVQLGKKSRTKNEEKPMTKKERKKEEQRMQALKASKLDTPRIAITHIGSCLTAETGKSSKDKNGRKLLQTDLKTAWDVSAKFLPGPRDDKKDKETVQGYFIQRLDFASDGKYFQEDAKRSIMCAWLVVKDEEGDNHIYEFANKETGAKVTIDKKKYVDKELTADYFPVDMGMSGFFFTETLVLKDKFLARGKITACEMCPASAGCYAGNEFKLIPRILDLDRKNHKEGTMPDWNEMTVGTTLLNDAMKMEEGKTGKSIKDPKAWKFWKMNVDLSSPKGEAKPCKDENNLKNCLHIVGGPIRGDGPDEKQKKIIRERLKAGFILARAYVDRAIQLLGKVSTSEEDIPIEVAILLRFYFGLRIASGKQGQFVRDNPFHPDTYNGVVNGNFVKYPLLDSLTSRKELFDRCDLIIKNYGKIRDWLYGEYGHIVVRDELNSDKNAGHVHIPVSETPLGGNLHVWATFLLKLVKDENDVTLIDHQTAHLIVHEASHKLLLTLDYFYHRDVRQTIYDYNIKKVKEPYLHFCGMSTAAHCIEEVNRNKCPLTCSKMKADDPTIVDWNTNDHKEFTFDYFLMKQKTDWDPDCVGLKENRFVGQVFDQDLATNSLISVSHLLAYTADSYGYFAVPISKDFKIELAVAQYLGAR